MSRIVAGSADRGVAESSQTGLTRTSAAIWTRPSGASTSRARQANSGITRRIAVFRLSINRPTRSLRLATARRATADLPVEHMLVCLGAGWTHPRAGASGCGLQALDVWAGREGRGVVRVGSVEQFVERILVELRPAQSAM